MFAFFFFIFSFKEGRNIMVDFVILGSFLFILFLIKVITIKISQYISLFTMFNTMCFDLGL